MRSRGAILFGQKAASGYRPHAQHIEIVSGHEQAPDALRSGVAAQVKWVQVKGDQSVEDFVAVPKVLIVRIGHGNRTITSVLQHSITLHNFIAAHDSPTPPYQNA